MAGSKEIERFAEGLAARFRGKILEWYLKPLAEASCVYFRVEKESLKQVAEVLFREMDGKLSTISAVEHASFFELIYHFALSSQGILVNLKVELEKNKPQMPSLTPMIKGANYIEREIRDLFGIEFPGHPEPKRLILPDRWPEGKHPLRSDYKGVE